MSSFAVLIQCVELWLTGRLQEPAHGWVQQVVPTH